MGSEIRTKFLRISPRKVLSGAIEQIRRCIGRREGQESSLVVLDADIAGCFDNIAHELLLARVPTFRKVIHRWLKAGTVEPGTYAPTLAGMPQGGVISPLLANIALDGMERMFGIENARGEYLKPHERPGNRGIILVRYADDFLVFSRNRYEVEWYVFPKLRTFLGSRGLAACPKDPGRHAGGRLQLLGVHHSPSLDQVPQDLARGSPERESAAPASPSQVDHLR